MRVCKDAGHPVTTIEDVTRVAPEEICGLLCKRFGDSVVQAVVEGAHPHARVLPTSLPDVAMFLRDDPRVALNLLRCISALDLVEDDKLACIYDLCHVPTSPAAELVLDTCVFALRVEVDRADPVIPSVAKVWPAADWHEREAFDLMGITFSDHPDLRRILCPDDWEGHPLRKDYVSPLEYHGIAGSTEYELTNPRH